MFSLENQAHKRAENSAAADVSPCVLTALAAKYIWWKTPAEAVKLQDRLIAQVMNIGDYADVQTLAHRVGDGVLREVLANAQAGQFNERSWAYWHYRLGLAALGQVPPLPARRLVLPLNRDAIAAAFSFMGQSTVLQDQKNTLSVLVPYGDSERNFVKVSFFGTIGFGRVGTPDVTEDGILQVASFDDLMATKVKVILQRAEAKDYRDIAAMVEAKVDLSKGLAAAREMYGVNFQPSESLKAMVYFEDGDLDTLSHGEKATLVTAASLVRDLPSVAIVARQLTAAA